MKKETKKENSYVHEGVRPITPEEQAIAARVMAEGSEWQELGEDSIVDFKFGKDIFELPEPAKKKVDSKEFAFRWIKRDPHRVDEMRTRDVPYRWWICNSTNTPFLQKFLDPVLGCVCREDQMLMFKPWWMRDAEWKIKRGLADALDDSGNLLNRDGQIIDPETGMEWRAGKRSMMGKEMNLEVRGGDVIMADEAVLDQRAGRRDEMVTDSDLEIEE